MKMGTAWGRRKAEDLTRSWRHGGRARKLAMLSAGLCLAVLCAAAASVGLAPAFAQTSSQTAGLPVPAGQLRAIDSAAPSCPVLSPPRLAAQLMAASRFNPHATTAGGGSGVAGLTATQWHQWAPAPNDLRSNVTANIVALAHDVCNLAGEVRAAHAAGSPWRSALAAFHSGLPAVIAARGIPAAAAGYVKTVAAYAAWYALQPQFRSGSPAAAAPAKSSAAKARATPPAASTPAPGGAAFSWRLAWSAGFNGPAGRPPDPASWSYDTGGNGWGNSELEYYTTSTANAALDGHGHLVITARDTGTAGLSCWYGPCRYTSARLVTLGHFSQAYGQISARIKLPGGSGIWPSFWALGDNFATAGWPQAGQINIMSFPGNTPATVSSGLIGPGYTQWSGDTLASGTFTSAYHTFTVDWYPDHASFYIDGHLYDTQYAAQAGAGWVFDHPFFLILNLAVGGTRPGSPAATTFPQQMLVDWVRVYTAGPPPAPVTGPVTGLDGKCATAAGDGTVRLGTCDGSPAQTWTIDTDGTVRAAGQCLGLTASGTAAQLATCDASPAQQWQAQTNGQLASTSPGKCLDATAGTSPLQISDCAGTPSQLWTLP